MDNLRKFMNKLYLFENNLKRWFNKNIDWFYIFLIIASVCICFKVGYVFGKLVLHYV